MLQGGRPAYMTIWSIIVIEIMFQLLLWLLNFKGPYWMSKLEQCHCRVVSCLGDTPSALSEVGFDSHASSY